MKKIKLLTILSVFIALVGCQPNEEVEQFELKRMPYNQKVFFLDKQDGWSHVYEVTYDFQGLQGEATVKPFVKVKGGSHMTVSPIVPETGERYLTIVNNGKPGKIHLVNINDASDHRVLDLYQHTGAGESADAVNNNRVNITQVDYDQNNFLFIAGKGGFFRVSADYSDMNPYVWTEGFGKADDMKAFAVQLAHNGKIEMFEEDGEDYFDDENAKTLKRPKFAGGDIFFTQNSNETADFEKERLISVTQAHGNAAIWVELEFGKDGKALNYNAKKLFSLMKVTKGGVGKVTGGALMGDNHIITSHHYTDVFQIRTLGGDLIAEPKIKPAEDVDFTDWKIQLTEDGYLYHNWGDMAAVQTFDDDFTAESRTINEDDSYFPFQSNAEFAEIELYRPGASVLNQYDVDDDNPDVSTVARRNSSNADIADLRANAKKFVSLGKDNGYVIMKFNEQITTTDDTRLQLVETSWGKAPEYKDASSAYKAYPEQASVYVSNYDGNYIGDWIEDDKVWIKVGDAYISSTIFSIPNKVISSFKWVKIVDDNSKSPDGFDVNFVATYEEGDDNGGGNGNQQ